MPERKIRMDTQEILLQFKNGQMSLEEAEGYLKRQPFEEMGYAKLDSHRKLRSGFAEVIFCSRKADAHLLEIFRRLYEEEGEVLGTRASQHQYELLKKELESRSPSESLDVQLFQKVVYKVLIAYDTTVTLQLINRKIF